MNTFLRLFLFLNFLITFATFGQQTTPKKAKKRLKISISIKSSVPNDSIRLAHIKRDSLFLVKEKSLKNEFFINVAELFAFKKIDFTYERFIKNNHSALFNLILGDSFGFETPKSYSTFTASVGYVGYFSKKHFKGFYVNPYIAYRQNFDINGFALQPTYSDIVSDKFAGVGLNMGYKLTVKRISLKAQIGVTRNFNPFYSRRFVPNRGTIQKSYSDLKANVGLGFRF